MPDYGECVERAMENTKAGGDIEAALVYAVLALAEAVRNPQVPERKTGSVKM